MDDNWFANPFKDRTPFLHLQEIVNEAMQKRAELIDAQIKHICYNYLEPPIKGEITKGKLRWRGVKKILYGYDGNLIGVIQRDMLIMPNGTKEKQL